jgi:hypothetical protein
MGDTAGRRTMAGKNTADLQLVTRKDLDDIWDYIEKNATKLTDLIKDAHKRVGANEQLSLKFLRQLANHVEALGDERWPASNPRDHHVVFALKLPGVENKEVYGRYARGASIYLEAACKALGKPQRIYAKKIKTGQIALAWKDYDAEGHAVSKQKPFSRIFVVGNLWPTEFAAEFMRGAYSMARELNIELKDKRISQGSRGDGRGAILLRSLVESEHLEPEKDGIMIFSYNHNNNYTEIRHLMSINFVIVTTGYSNGIIRQDNVKLGSELARRCVEDEKSPGGRLVIVLDFGESPENEFYHRQDALVTGLRDSGVFEVPDPVKVEPPRMAGYNDATKAAITAIEKQLAQHGREKIAAIFPRTESATKAAIRLISSSPSDHSHIRIYGERLLSSDLAILGDKDSPLWGVCGVDPYYYARFVVRAASCSWTKSSWEVPPVLVGKEDATADDKKIIDAERIPAYFPGIDVQLNHPDYAWDSWMRDRCPGSYGPDRYPG